MNETKKTNILLVDDRPQNLLALEGLLAGLDENIVKATSGNEALSLMLEYDFALVLLDVQMPVMDGFETAEVMRSNQRTKHVPIVFVTAISKDQKHVFKGYEVGAVDYLFKPIEPEILISKVKVFLDLHRQKRALGKSTEALEQTVEELKQANQTILQQQESLKESEEKLRRNNVQLERGLSEVFEALTRISSGDPSVRIAEDSELELIAKFKHIVNLTAQNIGEIVDLSHEFAVGLAEHFDVLDRVSKGDLSARVSGSSQVELLESLEKVTNKMIESVSRGIDERKRAEEERRKLQAHLQRAEKMELIGTLAGGVAHDLNNVLSGVVTYPDLLLMELPEDSPLRGPILTIQKSGQKAATIVQDLLTLARRGVVATEVSNLNEIITDYLGSPECEKLREFHTGVQIVTSLETDLLNILASPVHLSKTVMNLVSNASEALPDGGKVTISTGNQYIDRPIRGYDEVKDGDYVVLSVADNGTGIAAADLERIFEPFYTKKVMGRSGTGLGMAVVWGTVKDHKGYIDVQSTEGQGTTFDLYFPVTRKEAEKDKFTTSPDSYMGNGEIILVVDDVHEQREIASMLLTKLGYSVNAVSSGEEAVEYMKNSSADLLLLDMIMDPGIDGLDTYNKIRELYPEQKAIIASGFSETDRVKEAQKLGAGQYVRKPYTLEKIGLAVRSELRK